MLQRQVEDLDGLRVAHYQEILEHEEQVWDFVQGKVSLVVRSTLDVLDRFTSKAYVYSVNLMNQKVLTSRPAPTLSLSPCSIRFQILLILMALPNQKTKSSAY